LIGRSWSWNAPLNLPLQQVDWLLSWSQMPVIQICEGKSKYVSTLSHSNPTLKEFWLDPRLFYRWPVSLASCTEVTKMPLGRQRMQATSVVTSHQNSRQHDAALCQMLTVNIRRIRPALEILPTQSN
jgi:hypothetical protein